MKRGRNDVHLLLVGHERTYEKTKESHMKLGARTIHRFTFTHSDSESASWWRKPQNCSSIVCDDEKIVSKRTQFFCESEKLLVPNRRAINYYWSCIGDAARFASVEFKSGTLVFCRHDVEILRDDMIAEVPFGKIDAGSRDTHYANDLIFAIDYTSLGAFISACDKLSSPIPISEFAMAESAVAKILFSSLEVEFKWRYDEHFRIMRSSGPLTFIKN